MHQRQQLLSRAPAARARQRGFGMMDALVALGILSFGLLAMTRFQARMIAQATESQNRLVAAQYADELLSTALVDRVNAACYTLPQQGACATPAAKARAAAWAASATAALPSGVASAAIVAAGTQQRLVVNLLWTARDPNDPQRKLEATTDVTP